LWCVEGPHCDVHRVLNSPSLLLLGFHYNVHHVIFTFLVATLGLFRDQGWDKTNGKYAKNKLKQAPKDMCREMCQNISMPSKVHGTKECTLWSIFLVL
jgi:hypothetical protein